MSTKRNWVSQLRGLLVACIAMTVVGVGGWYLSRGNPEAPLLTGGEGGAADPHDHEGHAHGETESIAVSPQVRANLRLETASAEVRQYTEYIEVPGVVTDWPGQTHVSVTSPLTGVIRSVNVTRGELIESGTPLFTLRLTHQDLVNTQESFLSQLGKLDVEQREILRLASIASSGAIAGKTRLAREYERDKLLAGVRAARQAMLLHGLTENQVDQIEASRELIREVVVSAPIIHSDNSLHHDSLHHHSESIAGGPRARLASAQPPVIPDPDLGRQADHQEHVDAEFLVSLLDVRRGQAVTSGEQLAQLSDYSRLLIEGHAFQRDSNSLRQAADTGGVQAVFDQSGGKTELLEGLQVNYIGNEIGRDSRSLPFYVSLTNQVERSQQQSDKRFVSWRYKPGMRLLVRLPVETIDNAIVVPKEAVAEEGPERYVFVENGDSFNRVAVHVLSRDSVHVAIANDGQVWPGQKLAVRGAHQLQMAMRNQSGGAIDPHAGHSH